jgi:NAD+ diphosphatase
VTVAPFVLRDPPVLSRSAVLRDEPLRTDVERQRKGWPSARLVVVDAQGRTPVVWEDAPAGGHDVAAGRWDLGGAARLDTRPAGGDLPPTDAVLLARPTAPRTGRCGASPTRSAAESWDDATTWADLRTTGAVLDALGAACSPPRRRRSTGTPRPGSAPRTARRPTRRTPAGTATARRTATSSTRAPTRP